MRGIRTKSSINEHKLDSELMKEFSRLEKAYNELLQKVNTLETENAKLKQLQNSETKDSDA